VNVRRTCESIVWGAAVVVGLTVAGCSDPGTGSSVPAPSATSVSVSVSASASAGVATSSGRQAGAAKRGAVDPRPGNAGQDGVVAAVSVRELCAALKDIRPAVRAADTNRERRAEISIRLTQVYSARQLAGQMQPASVDALTKKACPRTRSLLLRSARLRSLADL
jgi:hypothetical protein